ncbi:MAG: hypothetical protein NXY57DRAFT_11340 [Lentinula lateritia]|nr:MAG: hypothetical protein NXY57DRAFT_11340 [Lentinula lateritia]
MKILYLLTDRSCDLLRLLNKQDLKRVGLVASVVVDFVIAVAMIMLLKDTDSIDGAAQSKPFKRISRIMRRLTVTIVNTGLVTAVVTIISLILVLMRPLAEQTFGLRFPNTHNVPSTFPHFLPI